MSPEETTTKAPKKKKGKDDGVGKDSVRVKFKKTGKIRVMARRTIESLPPGSIEYV